MRRFALEKLAAAEFADEFSVTRSDFSANRDHMRTNADVDFEITEDDMDSLQGMEEMRDYGDASMFPVYSGA